MSKTAFALICCGILAVSTPAWAGDDHKHDHAEEAGHTQLGAHEHGHGKLNIAIAAKTVAIELEIPAADIIGFEHAAKTDAQKATLADGKAKLGDPLKLFVFDAAANCTLTSAEVEAEGAIAGDDHGHDHGHDHDHDKADAGEESHSEFHATYEVTCADPDQLTAIEFAFFKTFTNSEELDVSLIGDKGTKTFEASAENVTLSLGGAS